MDTSSIKFGPGMTREAGFEVTRPGWWRVTVVTDSRMARLQPVQTALDSWRAGNIEAALFDATHIEPTHASLKEAVAFASAGGFDGYVAVAGGDAEQSGGDRLDRG